MKKSYGEEVLEAAKNIAKKCEKEVISLANLCLPALMTVLARQRREHGISEVFLALPSTQLSNRLLTLMTTRWTTG